MGGRVKPEPQHKTELRKLHKGKLIETKFDKFNQSYRSIKRFEYFKKTNFKKVKSKSNIISRQGQGMVKAKQNNLNQNLYFMGFDTI